MARWELPSEAHCRAIDLERKLQAQSRTSFRHPLRLVENSKFPLKHHVKIRPPCGLQVGVNSLDSTHTVHGGANGSVTAPLFWRALMEWLKSRTCELNHLIACVALDAAC